jgi:PIN domain nuclease of toxin-antitoxin system
VTALRLDAGAFAMVLTDDPRLPTSVRARIEGADRVALSVISLYEIGRKVRLGKWPEIAPFAAGLPDQALADGFDPIPLSLAVALAAALMAWEASRPVRPYGPRRGPGRRIAGRLAGCRVRYGRRGAGPGASPYRPWAL